MRVPGLTPKQNSALTAEFAIAAGQRLSQLERHDRLRALALPLAQIRFDEGGIDVGAVYAIAEQLSEQLELEDV